MAQLKDKVGSFFAWARKDKPAVSVDVTRRDDAEGSPDNLPEQSPEAAKEVTLQQVKQGYIEVVETMKSVRGHLEQQADRSERMLSLLEDLPEALRSLPETTRTQTGVLKGIQAHLEDQNQTSRQLTEAITGLATASSHQQRSLTSLDSHLAEGQETRSQLNDGVAALTDTLGEVRESNAATRESIGAVVDQTRQNEQQMREMLHRNQKTSTLMMVLCLALAIGALALGGYVAFMVSQITRDATPITITPVDTASETTNTPSVNASFMPTDSSNAYRAVVPQAPPVTPENTAVVPGADPAAEVDASALIELNPATPVAPAIDEELEHVGPPAPTPTP